MILPKDRTVYANLSTSFTGFGELLLELKATRHSGFVRVGFPGYEGVLFMLAGEVIHALEEVQDVRVTGPAAVTAIRARASGKNGLINVEAAPPEIVRLIAQVLESEPLYKDLTSSFTSLERLFTKLQQDGLTGYVEIVLADDSGSAMVLFQDGNPLESVFISGAESLTGLDARTAVVHSVNTVGGTFNVFRAAASQPQTAPVPVRAVADVQPLLDFWGEVCHAVEEVADGLSSRGRFQTAFKEVLVSRANTYAFLDPFAAEFEYHDGAISFDGPLPEEFSKALGACLGDTIAKLAFQLKRADLENRVRAQLAGASEKHASIIETWGLDDDVREFVA